MIENGKKPEENELIPDGEMLPEDLEMDEETGEATLQDKLKTLKKKLAACDEEKRAYLEDLQRVRADFLNSKRRLEEQFSRDKERATDKILIELLSLADSFDTAMKDKELWNSIDEKWRVGVEAIHTKLSSILSSNNVETIDPLGQKFNPEEHNAVSNTPVEKEKDIDTVVGVLQKGFKRNGTVIRPAMVVVGTK